MKHTLLAGLVIGLLTGCDPNPKTYEISATNDVFVVWRVNTKTGEVCRFQYSGEGAGLQKICDQ